jgi:hypothetical protein
MDNFTLEQLDQAKHQLDKRMKQARADREYLSAELPRLIVGHVLGVVTLEEIEDTRRRLAECLQVFEETPAALVVLKGLIEQAREKEAQEQRNDEFQQMRPAYFAIRKEIIASPKLADSFNGPAGRFESLSVKLGRDFASGRLFNEECRKLITEATVYVRHPKSEPFSFTVLIPE